MEAPEPPGGHSGDASYFAIPEDAVDSSAGSIPASFRNVRRLPPSQSSNPWKIAAPVKKDRGIAQSLLVLIAGMVIKVASFQFGLLISSLTLPIWILHCSLLLAIDPFRTVNRAAHSVEKRLAGAWRALLEGVSLRLRIQRELVVRLAWGFFWSTYVCLVLVGLLVAAFLAGSRLVRRVTEEPVMTEEGLNFDYTKVSPEALVALESPASCGGAGRVLGCVPANRRLLLTVSLTLPESDYNRKLGIFQVRADFLSEDGQVTGSSSHPCMLHFKSSHIRYLETILKSGSLLAGYSLESQILILQMAGFTERTEQTAFVRVILEQRAKYGDGAGIPEIYAASLRLESELPLSKRTIWNWRWTVFIWISTGIFVLELMVILACCRPVILPRTRARHISFKEISLHGKTKGQYLEHNQIS